MGTIRVGCQTYTWEMLGANWRGTVEEILDAIAIAGYQGIEIATPMLGEFSDRPGDFAKAVRERGLVLASVAHPAIFGWTDPGRREEEIEAALRSVAWTKEAGCALLGLGGPASQKPGSRAEALEVACQLYDRIGELALSEGVQVHIHPHSHHGSVVESDAEYDALLAQTSPAVTWFGPDVGHMIRGGVDYLAVLRRHRDRLLHVHLKDVTADGRWAPIGEGVCDVKGLISLLSELDFDGWLILEEESDSARADPAAAIRPNRQRMAEVGL